MFHYDSGADMPTEVQTAAEVLASLAIDDLPLDLPSDQESSDHNNNSGHSSHRAKRDSMLECLPSPTSQRTVDRPRIDTLSGMVWLVLIGQLLIRVMIVLLLSLCGDWKLL